VHNILTHPVYAGAYAFGRTTSKAIIEEGRKRVRRGLRRPQQEKNNIRAGVVPRHLEFRYFPFYIRGLPKSGV
jgi:hypothetical protein